MTDENADITCVICGLRWDSHPEDALHEFIPDRDPPNPEAIRGHYHIEWFQKNGSKVTLARLDGTRKKARQVVEQFKLAHGKYEVINARWVSAPVRRVVQ
jgi:hypothetical protein